MKSLVFKNGDEISVNNTSTISRVLIPASTDARERRITAMLTHDNLSSIMFDGKTYTDIGDPLISHGLDGKRSVLVLDFAKKEAPEDKTAIFEDLRKEYRKEDK